MLKENKESKFLFIAISLIFISFLILPTTMLLSKSFESDGGFGLVNYKNMLFSQSFTQSLKNSFVVSICTAILTTSLAFFLSYTINNTNVNKNIKSLIKNITTLPMLLPTITYGFAIIYSFGKQGLITKILGFELFDIYGFNGLLLGYTIYTLPTAFILINNTFKFIDKKFMIVSRIMGDKPIKTFYTTVFKPLIGTLAGAFIQAFFLSFTDFGIPASVGGNYSVVATSLYNEMLGSVPNFNNGAVIAIIMLIPSIVGIMALTYLEKYNFRYNKISEIEISKNKLRDLLLGGLATIVTLGILSIFIVIFIVPFVNKWPYDTGFTFNNIKKILSTSTLSSIYFNSLLVAILTSLFGTFISYCSALVTSRSSIDKRLKSIIEYIALVTNTIPGMVLGISFLLTFSGTSIQNTFFILIICNIVHFFSTPYLMMKNSLSKMNSSFETTAKLLGDSYIKTVVRIITPNIKSTLLEVFNYYFINSMVTISAVIFLTSAKTMVITTKIKELQHYAKFDEIFVLSILILVTNLISKLIFTLLASKEKSKKLKFKYQVATVAISIITITGIIVGCSSKKSDQVIIYSNADEEIVNFMSDALNKNGYEDKYIIQSFGTSELGGKILAEGKNIEADLVTMSSYYIDTAQQKYNMFSNLEFERNTIDKYPDYQTPLTALQGTLIVNTEIIKENNLKMPTSLKDLASKEYEGLISIPDITGSSTGWLLIQALLNEYPEDEAREIMSNLIKNAGPHLESSGSAPLKKVRAGEVSVAFGLRHQAIKDKQEGLPIDYIDPVEGNFPLPESVAVIDKEDNEKEELVQEIARCIIDNARGDILDTYQSVLYEGENVDTSIAAKYPKNYKEALTIDLLEQHKKFSEDSKK
ncbi:MAG: ABC transporter permease subunit [Peptostreptococcaceae bacterium]